MSLEQRTADMSLDPPTRAEPTPEPVPPTATAVAENIVTQGEWDDVVAAYTGPKLSQRALNPAKNFIGSEKLDTILRTTYDPVTNPDGKINLGIAENSLLVNEYLEFFGGALKDNLTPLDLAYGNQASGSRRLHSAIADMWNENFAPIEPVLPDQIVTGPGASSVLDHLVCALLNPEEGILIAAPHYNGFDVNMVSRSYAHVEHVRIPAAEAFSPSSLEYFERSLAECTKRGVRVGAVLVCSPQNPFGRTYDKETLVAYAAFAEKHDLHLISDELYALSVYENPDYPDLPPFMSMLSIDFAKEMGRPFNKSRLHIVYSFSKDFGVNGFRVGAMISQHNNLMLRALYHTGFLYKVSSPADVLLSALMNNKPKFKEMMALNRKRLAEASQFVAEWFKKRGMTPFPCNAGHFMMVDGTKALGLKTFEDELEFGRHCAAHGVFIGIGQSYHAAEPGWLRVTFSVDRKMLEIALGRLDRALADRKL